MQKRFCSCGQVVLVSYFCRNGSWRPVLTADARRISKKALGLCPSCKNALSIHNLR